MYRHRRSAYLGALGLIASALGCSSGEEKPPGQLVISITTDLEVPKDIDHLGVEVTQEGSIRYSVEYEVGTSGASLPATLTAVAGDHPEVPATIRVFSRKGLAPKTIREVITTVPTDRIALLHVGIQWLCWNQVEDPGIGTPLSLCPGGQTCIAGTCGDPNVDPESLEDYTEEAIYGGATLGGEGACFDTIGCFSTGSIVPVDGECSVEDPGGDVNVAIVLPPDGPGICGPEACLVPLDGNSAEGWQRSGGRLVLPQAACERPGSAIAVTTDCPTKTAGIPTCGPWSAVSGNAQFDEGAPAGDLPSVGDAGAGGGDAGAN